LKAAYVREVQAAAERAQSSGYTTTDATIKKVNEKDDKPVGPALNIVKEEAEPKSHGAKA